MDARNRVVTPQLESPVSKDGGGVPNTFFVSEPNNTGLATNDIKSSLTKQHDGGEKTESATTYNQHFKIGSCARWISLTWPDTQLPKSLAGG